MSWFKNIFGDSKGSKDGGSAESATAGSKGGRGKSSSPPPADARQKAIASIQGLKEQIEQIDQRIEFQNLKVQEEEAKVKALLQECGADAKKKERKKPEIQRHLMAIQRYKKVVEQEFAKKLNFETMVSTFETSLSSTDQHAALKNVQGAMSVMAPKADEVDDLKADLEETMEGIQAVTDLLTQPMGPAANVDEDELDKMMAEYGDEAAEEVECRTRILAFLSLTVACRALRTTPNCRCCSTPRSSSLLQARKRCPRAPGRLLLPVLRKISIGARLHFSAS
jgi:hypothetical protein